MTTSTYAVSGMTCGHCVAAVTEEVAALAGVTDVVVDLENGSVQLTSVSEVPYAVVAAAVDEAGYTLVPA